MTAISPDLLPAQGWNSWYAFGASLTAAGVLEQAEYLISSGLAAAGYDTVVLDDGWQDTKRDASGNLAWNPVTFPDGIPHLSYLIHQMGLKFGIYTAIGTHTCANHGGFPGSFGHYAQDAEQFARWGASFVKVDSCKGLPPGTTNLQLTGYFEQFGAELRAYNPSVTYNQALPVLMPIGSADYTAAIAASSRFSNLWRMTPDQNFTVPASVTILSHLAADLHLHGYARPGHWNDLDYLVGANKSGSAHPFSWTLAEQQSQLSVWAMEASPLIISTDLTALTTDELAILKNPDMLAVNQSGTQAASAVVVGNMEYVFKGADGGMAVLLVNLGTGTESQAVPLTALHVPGTSASVYNVWTGVTTQCGSELAWMLPRGETALLVLNKG
jgi:alpha-galactosidase